MSIVSNDQVRQLFKDRIWPAISENLTPSSKPKAYVLGGQPGAGKSGLLALATEKHTGNLLVINGDEFRPVHPDFKKLHEKHGLNTAKHTAQFSGAITGLALEKAVQEKYNIAIEGTFRTAETPINTLNDFKKEGYETTVMIATCPKDVSWTSTLHRYSELAEVGELARYTPKDAHDVVVDNLAKNAQAVMDSGLADRMMVFNRSSQILDTSNSEHNLTSVINRELNRPLTQDEHKGVLDQYNRIETLQKQIGSSSELKASQNQKNAYILRSQDKSLIEQDVGLSKIQKNALSLSKTSNRAFTEIIGSKATSIEKGILKVQGKEDIER